MDPETSAEPEAPQLNITVTTPETPAEITEAEAAQIATAAETVTQAASAAVALAEVEAARTIADRDAEIEELKSWQTTASLQLDEFSRRMNSMQDMLSSILPQQQAQIEATAAIAVEALAEVTEENAPPSSPEEQTPMEVQPESVAESPAPEAAPAKRVRVRTFI